MYFFYCAFSHPKGNSFVVSQANLHLFVTFVAINTFPEFLSSLTPFVDVSNQPELVQFLSDRDAIVRSLQTPLPRKNDIARTPLRDSVFQSSTVFNVNPHAECYYLAQLIEAFDTFKGVSSTRVISKANVLVSSIAITGGLGSC
jgi:hypothetical protein